MKSILMSAAICIATAIPVAAESPSAFVVEGCLKYGRLMEIAMLRRDLGIPIETLLEELYARPDLPSDWQDNIARLYISGYNSPEISAEVLGAIAVGGCIEGGSR